MKFIDLLKEPTDDKLLKKAKTIFSALRKGKITRGDGVSFSYELGGRTHARVYDGEVELIGSVISIKENTYCPINQRYMTELIEKKFEMFGINVELRPPNEDQIEKYQGKKPWEKEEINEDDITEKERKRVKTIHKAIRKGVINLNNGRYRYELPEDYKFYLIDNEIINIKFTFHNHDLGQNFGGLGLPLRIWRVEEGKDVFINGLLSKDDVSDIVYGDEYLINTKSGAEYTNVKNKVRNKYRNFNINAIMTSPSDDPMDLTPMVNEGENVNQEKLKQKANAVYKAIRKGKMKIYINGEHREPAIFSYELSEEKSIITTVIGDIFITPEFFMIKHLNKECLSLIRNDVEKAFKKEFMDKFNIRLRTDNLFYDDHTEFYDYNEKGLNESEEDKMIKKGKTVFKALKKGTIGSKDDPNEPHFKYELSNNITIDRNNVGIILTTDRIKIKELNRACRHNDPDYMGSLIRKRFSHFGIVFTSPYGDRYFNYDVKPWEKEEVNEGAEVLNFGDLTDKEIKKVKLLYKSFKEMVFTYDQLSYYGIVLPDNYYIYKDELGEVCIKLDKQDTDKLDMFARIKFTSGNHYDRPIEPHHDGLQRWVKERVINKFDGFNVKFIF